jgi:hypothetical protein
LSSRISQFRILVKHGHNARDTLSFVLVGLYRAAPVLRLLTTEFNVGTGRQDVAPSRLSAPSKRSSTQRLVNLEFSTTNTHASQRIYDPWKKLNEEDGLCQAIVTKVTGTSVVCLATRTANLSVFQNPHFWIKEPPHFGLVPLKRPL